MPKAKLSAFMMFTREWRKNHGKKLSTPEAVKCADSAWRNMSAQVRHEYKLKAQRENDDAKLEATAYKTLNRGKGKFDCTGRPLEQIARQKQDAENKIRLMKRHIEATVKNASRDRCLETKKFFFLMTNHFFKDDHGTCLPAEIAISCFSLKEGVTDVYHSFINPGSDTFGHTYDAKHWSETTHNLPLPPNAMGEKDLSIIYNGVIKFILKHNNEEMVPVYTDEKRIDFVKSVMDFLSNDGTQADDTKNIKIYSIHYLLHIMKLITCEIGGVPKPENAFVTNAQFDQDFFEYQAGISCQYHEEIDKGQFCAKSCVTRWGFCFSDYLCKDIAIKVIPGRHHPTDFDINTMRQIREPDDNPDRRPVQNFHKGSNSDSSVGFGEMVSERSRNDDIDNDVDDDDNYNDYGDNNGDGDDDDEEKNSYDRFNTRNEMKSSLNVMNARQTSVNHSKPSASLAMDDDDIDHNESYNPWASRSRTVPAEPNHDGFDIAKSDTFPYARGRGSPFSENESYSTDPSTSFVSADSSRGRGRGRGRGCGRGYLFNMSKFN